MRYTLTNNTMSEKIINDQGEEVEVFTAEEVQQQVEAAKSAHPDQNEELTKLQEDLKAAQEELTKLQGKDLNFANLRLAKEAAERRAEEAKKELEEKLGTFKNEIFEGVNKEHYDATLDQLSGGDAELKKKIEYHYKRIADPVTNKTEIGKKLADAYILATKREEADAMNSAVLASGGAARVAVKAPGQALSSDEKALLQKMERAGGLPVTE